MKSFINKYNWEGINFPSEKDDWKNLSKKNNLTVAVNILYDKKEKICPTYVSKLNSNRETKQNSNREKQLIIFMIPNGKI